MRRRMFQATVVMNSMMLRKSITPK